MVTNKEKNFISAVVYVHNNSKEIEKFLKQLNNQLNKLFEKYEIICVNDSSNDDSSSIIKKVAKEFDDTVISVINMSYFQGLEVSMNAGVDLSIGDFVYEFDNINIDYNIALINDIYRKSLEGFDIVSAISNKKNKFTSGIFYQIFNKYSNSNYKLETESFRILSRRAINRIHAMSQNIPYRKALYAKCGLKMISVKYTSNSKSKYNISKKTNQYRKTLAIDSLVLFTNVAYKISVLMTFLLMLFTVSSGIYTIIIFALQKPVAGYTSIMLLLSIAFTGIFLFLAIIIKYLDVIININFVKQNYIIESVEKISK